MGRLSGFSYRVIIKRLKLFDFEFLRQAAGSHEIWYNKKTDSLIIRIVTYIQILYFAIKIKKCE